MAPPVLRFADISKTYRLADGRLHHALHHASAEVAGGSRIAVIGRSGSGKSTFLHLAAGIDSPSEGRVELCGRDLASLSEAERTRLRRDAVGFVFQFFHLLGHLSVLDNVLLPCWIAGDRDASLRSRALELLDRVGLAGRAGDPVQKLS